MSRMPIQSDAASSHGLARADLLRQSNCDGLPSFVPHDIYPMRSPLVVADFLVRKLSELHRHTKGKHLQYVEIGTRDGDNVACVAQLSHHTIGPGAIIANAVEQSPRRCLALRNRSAVMLPHGGGFGVIEGSVNESTYRALLPIADVYYYWMYPELNLPMIRWIDEATRERAQSASVFIGFDWHFPDDRWAFVEQITALRQAKGNRSTSLRRLFFDESGGREDISENDESTESGTPHWPTRVSQNGLEKVWRPSYLRPFARRPGQWGVFHVLEVRVGSGSARLPIHFGQQTSKKAAKEAERAARRTGARPAKQKGKADDSTINPDAGRARF